MNGKTIFTYQATFFYGMLFFSQAVASVDTSRARPSARHRGKTAGLHKVMNDSHFFEIRKREAIFGRAAAYEWDKVRYLLQHDTIKYKQSIFEDAARFGMVPTIQFFIQTEFKHMLDDQAIRRAFEYAVEYNRFEVVRYFIKKDFVINKFSKEVIVAMLKRAIARGQKEIVACINQCLSN